MIITWEIWIIMEIWIIKDSIDDFIGTSKDDLSQIIHPWKSRRGFYRVKIFHWKNLHISCILHHCCHSCHNVKNYCNTFFFLPKRKKKSFHPNFRTFCIVHSLQPFPMQQSPIVFFMFIDIWCIYVLLYNITIGILDIFMSKCII